MAKQRRVTVRRERSSNAIHRSGACIRKGYSTRATSTPPGPALPRHFLPTMPRARTRWFRICGAQQQLVNFSTSTNDVPHRGMGAPPESIVFRTTWSASESAAPIADVDVTSLAIAGTKSKPFQAKSQPSLLYFCASMEMQLGVPGSDARLQRRCGYRAMI
eukprot:scaffold470_cov257-Pinguiococcus_pyrenoidosus.AAC.10